MWLFWSLLVAARCQCPSPQVLLANLTAHYDALAHPGQLSGQAVPVQVMLYITSIVQMAQKDQQLVVDGYYRTQWWDERLALDRWPGCSTFVLEKEKFAGEKQIWQPDMYFDNSVSEWYGAGSIEISADGRIFRSQRFYHRFGCPMNFFMLPFDVQTCVIKIGSYSWDIANINVGLFSDGAVELPEGYTGTTEFELRRAGAEVETAYYGPAESRKGFSFILISLSLQRMPDSFLMFVFVTCICFALVAWSGLFINRNVAPARVAIAVIPVLIMLNLENSVISNLPPLNYLTWITSYLLLMKFFCLSAVFEYGLVSYLLTRESGQERKFEAFKGVAATVKRMADEKANGTGTEQRPSLVPLASPKIHPSKGSGAVGLEDIEVLRRSVVSAAPAEDEDVTSAVDLQQRFADAYRIFDRDGNRMLSWREVQKGFRRLGQYWSKDQVQELFFGLGLAGKKMGPSDFKRFMMDIQRYLPSKAMHIAFRERPPSYQVDVIFRWCYISGVLLSTGMWLLWAFAL